MSRRFSSEKSRFFAQVLTTQGGGGVWHRRSLEPGWVDIALDCHGYTWFSLGAETRWPLEVPPHHIFLMIYMKYSILGFVFRPILSWFIDRFVPPLLPPPPPLTGPSEACQHSGHGMLDSSTLRVDASMTVGTWTEPVGLKPNERSQHAARRWRNLANTCHLVQKSTACRAEQLWDSYPAAWASLHQSRGISYYGKGIFFKPDI